MRTRTTDSIRSLRGLGVVMIVFVTTSLSLGALLALLSDG